MLDLPPGTGDIQLTIVQTVALAGAVIVTTPQEVALIDARKAAQHVCEGECARARADRKHELLPLPERRASGTTSSAAAAGAREAARLGVPLLGQMPIDIATREAGDRGLPIAASAPESPAAQEFREIARETCSFPRPLIGVM